MGTEPSVDQQLREALASVLSGRALTVQEAARYLSLAPSTLNKWRTAEMNGPPYVQAVPNGAVRYRFCDLNDWQASRTIRNTSEAH